MGEGECGKEEKRGELVWERNAGKNGRMRKGRTGVGWVFKQGNEYTSEEERGSNEGGRDERTRRKKTSLTCQCTAFPPGAPRPAGPLALC